MDVIQLLLSLRLLMSLPRVLRHLPRHLFRLILLRPEDQNLQQPADLSPPTQAAQNRQPPTADPTQLQPVDRIPRVLEDLVRQTQAAPSPRQQEVPTQLLLAEVQNLQQPQVPSTPTEQTQHKQEDSSGE